MNDLRLLNQYTEAGSEEAFTCLAERYLNLVYSTCLRELCDAQLAEDATQVVFLLLARKAPALPRATALSGWLFHTARLVAKNMRRRERRRAFAEGEAVREEAIRNAPGREPGWGTDGDSDWETIEPHLHTALSRLRPPERNVLLLRFFEDRTLAEVGAALGLTEDAARMRVMRALGKLRRVLVSGSALPVAVLAGLLSERAVRAAPVSCADAFPRIAVGGAVAAKASGVLAGWHIHHLTHLVTQAMWKANLKVAAVVLGLGVVGAGTVPLVLHQFRPPPLTTSSMGMSVGAHTKPQAAREAARLFALQQKQVSGFVKVSQEGARLTVLLQRPGNQEKLRQAIKANPRHFLLSPMPRWGKIRTSSGQVAWEPLPPDINSLGMEWIRRQERVVAPPKGTPWPTLAPPVPIGPPSVLTVDLSYGARGKSSTMRLSGSTTQVLRRLNEIGMMKPHRAKPHKARRRRD